MTSQKPYLSSLVFTRLTVTRSRPSLEQLCTWFLWLVFPLSLVDLIVLNIQFYTLFLWVLHQQFFKRVVFIIFNFCLPFPSEVSLTDIHSCPCSSSNTPGVIPNSWILFHSVYHSIELMAPSYSKLLLMVYWITPSAGFLSTIIFSCSHVLFLHAVFSPKFQNWNAWASCLITNSHHISIISQMLRWNHLHLGGKLNVFLVIY